MEVDHGYRYPDFEVLLTFTPEEIDNIMNKGSLEDYHEDKIMEAIRHIFNHCRD